jgi:hypothetical protein
VISSRVVLNFCEVSEPGLTNDHLIWHPGAKERTAKQYKESRTGFSPSFLWRVVINWGGLIDRLQADLFDPNSRLKTTAKTGPWHAACADILIGALKDSNDAFWIKIKQRIRKQAIIPLTQDGQWTGALGASLGGSSEVYFAST